MLLYTFPLKLFYSPCVLEHVWMKSAFLPHVISTFPCVNIFPAVIVPGGLFSGLYCQSTFRFVSLYNANMSNFTSMLSFIGSSQSGLNSLETRGHGLEMALDELSHDLAVSSGEFPNSADDACCKLPGAEFLSSKIWKRAVAQYSTSRLSLGSIVSPKSVRNVTDKDASFKMFISSRRRFQHRGGLFVNPLADVRNNLKGHLQQYTCTIPNNMVQDAKRTEVNNVSQLDGISPVTWIASRKQNKRSSV